jgi:hypothetical protein
LPSGYQRAQYRWHCHESTYIIVTSPQPKFTTDPENLTVLPYGSIRSLDVCRGTRWRRQSKYFTVVLRCCHYTKIFNIYYILYIIHYTYIHRSIDFKFISSNDDEWTKRKKNTRRSKCFYFLMIFVFKILYTLNIQLKLLRYITNMFHFE